MYKVELSLKVDSPNTVRIIAAERQSTAEIEVQAWNTAEGIVTKPQHKEEEKCIQKQIFFIKTCFFFISES